MLFFSLISLISFFALQQTGHIWRRSLSRDNAVSELLKAHQALEADLVVTRADDDFLAIRTVPASLGGGADSDAIEFLTPLNLTTPTADTKLTQEINGAAYMICNVIFYAVVPMGHTTCVGGSVGGYDYNCPHKIFLRRVIDQNPLNDPMLPDSDDVLVKPWVGLLVRPTGYPHTPDFRTIAINLLSFRCNLDGPQLHCNLKAVALDEAQREVGIGTTSLATGRFTVEHSFSIFPKN